MNLLPVLHPDWMPLLSVQSKLMHPMMIRRMILTRIMIIRTTARRMTIQEVEQQKAVLQEAVILPKATVLLTTAAVQQAPQPWHLITGLQFLTRAHHLQRL